MEERCEREIGLVECLALQQGQIENLEGLNQILKAEMQEMWLSIALMRARMDRHIPDLMIEVEDSEEEEDGDVEGGREASPVYRLPSYAFSPPLGESLRESVFRFDTPAPQ